MKKSKISLFITLILVLTIGSTVNAAPIEEVDYEEPETTIESNEEDITPYWEHTSSTAIRLGFDGDTAQCYASFRGNNDVYKITVTAILEKKDSSGNYKKVKSWPATTKNTVFYVFNETVPNCSSGEYKLTVVGQIYASSDSVAEIVSLNGVATHK